MVFWKNALLQLFTEPVPPASDFNIISENENLWVVADKYPKAKFHYLIIPKVKIIHGVSDLLPSHLELLKKMKIAADELIGCGSNTESEFKVGFHSKPSLFQLHLHVISTDLSKTRTARHRESFSDQSMIFLDRLIAQFETYFEYNHRIEKMPQSRRLELIKLNDRVFKMILDHDHHGLHATETSDPDCDTTVFNLANSDWKSQIIVTIDSVDADFLRFLLTDYGLF